MIHAIYSNHLAARGAGPSLGVRARSCGRPILESIMDEDFEVEDWAVDLDAGRAINGGFTVSFYDTDDGGFSLNVIAGAQDLTKDERFGVMRSAMEAIYYAKVERG